MYIYVYIVYALLSTYKLYVIYICIYVYIAYALLSTYTQCTVDTDWIFS